MNYRCPLYFGLLTRRLTMWIKKQKGTQIIIRNPRKERERRMWRLEMIHNFLLYTLILHVFVFQVQHRHRRQHENMCLEFRELKRWIFVMNQLFVTHLMVIDECHQKRTLLGIISWEIKNWPSSRNSRALSNEIENCEWVIKSGSLIKI